jgi:AcrR family transcriptional regulator
MTTTTTRTRRHLRTKQAILDAAREIIAEDGINALSMRALADRIDYSPAGLYEYYGSKEEIVTAMCEEGQRFLYAAMAEVDRALPPVDYLYEIGLAYIRFALEHPDYFLVMFTAAPPPDMAGVSEDAVREMMQQEGSPYGILLRAIQHGIDEGTFLVRPGFGLHEMGYAAWTLVHGIAMLRTTALRYYPGDLDAADHHALLNFMRGLQTA